VILLEYQVFCPSVRGVRGRNASIEPPTYGCGWPALRLSSTTCLSAAKRQKVSKATVGINVTPEITIGSMAGFFFLRARGKVGAYGIVGM
jgi:hypothetical protein